MLIEQSCGFQHTGAEDSNAFQQEGETAKQASGIS
jgi:hypothetical protein